MENVLAMDKKSGTFWAEESINSSNVYDFIDFLIDMYPAHEAELVNIKKKVKKGSRSVLSLLITFSRNIDKKDKKNDELVFLTKKFIQAVMDNPKGFKK